MRLVIQRVQFTEMMIDGDLYSSIGQGLFILLGIQPEDGENDINWLSNKVLNLRIFDDENGVMNKSVQDINGDILVASQFTLHASTKKGNRPSYIKAAKPDIAIPLYEKFVETLKGSGLRIATGVFGADMKITLLNDGPVTIIIDSKLRE